MSSTNTGTALDFYQQRPTEYVLAMFVEYVCRTNPLNIHVYVHTDGVLSTLEPYVTKSRVDTVLFSTY